MNKFRLLNGTKTLNGFLSSLSVGFRYFEIYCITKARPISIRVVGSNCLSIFLVNGDMQPLGERPLFIANQAFRKLELLPAFLLGITPTHEPWRVAVSFDENENEEEPTLLVEDIEPSTA